MYVKATSLKRAFRVERESLDGSRALFLLRSAPRPLRSLYFAQTSLEDGFRRTIDWYEDTLEE
jgi:hypothetical protein